MAPLRDALSTNGRRAPPLSLREGNTARGAGCQVRPARRPPAGAAAAGGKRGDGCFVGCFFSFFSLILPHVLPSPPTLRFFFFRLTFFFFFSCWLREGGGLLTAEILRVGPRQPRPWLPPHASPRAEGSHGADERPRRTPAAAGELRRPEPERAGTGCPAAAAEEVTPLWELPEAGGTAAASRPSRRRERSARGARPEGRALRRAPS